MIDRPGTVFASLSWRVVPSPSVMAVVCAGGRGSTGPQRVGQFLLPLPLIPPIQHSSQLPSRTRLRLSGPWPIHYLSSLARIPRYIAGSAIMSVLRLRKPASMTKRERSIMYPSFVSTSASLVIRRCPLSGLTAVSGSHRKK